MVWTVISIILVTIVALKVLSFTGTEPVRPPDLSELPSCPEAPNCVCSQDSTATHAIDAIAISGSDINNEWARLHDVIEEQGGKRVDEKSGKYSRFEFRSFLFRYVDDVEVLRNDEQSQIEIRSASRSGYSDLGVNRRRVEAIRKRFTEIAND